jgi:predicted HicB family RNase H-like nuclease
MPHRVLKYKEIMDAAEKLFETKPDWMTFYREVMGLQGLLRREFPTIESMAEFEQTATYRQIQRMVTELRKKPLPENLEAEETRVVTIRIPQSMHESLRIEAYEYHTTMNKLCISKLLKFVELENVPPAFEERKKKTPVVEEEKTEAGL